MNILNYFNKDQIDVLNLIRESCKLRNIKAYIVGGAVRDALLGAASLNDIDICINEDPKMIIESLAGVEKYDYYDEFQTSTIVFQSGVNIDLIRCRRESYDKKGSLPKVTPSDIEDDLYRRDFTINALAYDLAEGTIVDLYNGIEDLKNKRLRKIHDNSYEEDPTRIFRGIRYAVRYKLTIQDKVEIMRCIDDRIINCISSDRVVKELYLLCSEKDWMKNISLCSELGIFNINEKDLGLDNLICNYEDINERILNLSYVLREEKYIGILLQNSFLHKELKRAIKQHKLNGDKIVDLLIDTMDNYKLYQILKDINLYGLMLLCWDNKLKYKIVNYVYNISSCKLDINGGYISSLGIKEGTKIGKLLSHMMKIKLNIGIKYERKYLAENLGEIIKCL